MSSNLDDISTQWSLIYRAHHGPSDACRRAQERLLDRYQQAVRNYLFGALRDREAATELYQEFAVRFVRGDFQRAEPDKGRFRSYLKRALSNLVTDYWRKLKARPVCSLDHEPIDDRDDDRDGGDARFEAVWRQTLTERAWRALRDEEVRQNIPGYTLLRRRVDANARSADLAVLVREQFQREVSEVWVRKRLYKTRERFIALFVNEVALSLTDPTLDSLEEELISIGMLGRCREELAERRRRGTVIEW